MNTALDRWTSTDAFFSDTLVQAVTGLLVLSVAIGFAFFALSRLRDSNTNDHPITDLLEKNFEEMRSEGDIDDQEFRKIKALLAGGPPSARHATRRNQPAAEQSQKNDAEAS